MEAKEEIKDEVKDAIAKDPGEKIIIADNSSNKIPVEGQLPHPDERLYYNANVIKPKRKKTELKVQFGTLTMQNVE